MRAVSDYAPLPLRLIVGYGFVAQAHTRSRP
jgi:hypothetical protein